MPHTHCLILVLGFLITPIVSTLSAQFEHKSCTVRLEGQNRERTVRGVFAKECVFPHNIGGPWGNWGVSSNYGDIRDADQFKGWHLMWGKRQWNSCTRDYIGSQYYSDIDEDGIWYQESRDTVTHGVMEYLTNRNVCPNSWYPVADPGDACLSLNGLTFTQSNNLMDIYELDWPDRDDFVTQLKFNNTSTTYEYCSESGCPKRYSEWVGVRERDTSQGAIVDAEIRMGISAVQREYCSVF